MAVPVLVEAVGGRFRASLAGAPGWHADGATRDDAVAALRADLAGRAARGELVWVDVPKVGLTDLAGRYGPDPHLDDIVAEAYRRRDEERAREFPA